jgi:hypothetical protein
MVVIDILLIALTLNAFGVAQGTTGLIGGIAEMVTALISFYACIRGRAQHPLRQAVHADGQTVRHLQINCRPTLETFLSNEQTKSRDCQPVKGGSRGFFVSVICL